MKYYRFYFLIIVVIFFLGCQTTYAQRDSREDMQEGMVTVAEAISGKSLSDAEVKDLTNQIKNDKEAQSAVQSITEVISGEVSLKYCPVTGKRYASHLINCPIHDVNLEIVE